MQAKSFHILDRQQKIHHHYLLEASAGTGKTFSVENLVVRLLLESSATIDQILVVTFTRAATRELKARVRSSIIKALDYFKFGGDSPPDYLLHIQEQGKATQSIQRLNQALHCFDEAQIFTIHSFCQQMLSDRVFAYLGNEVLSPQEAKKVVRDFFRTELRPEKYSKSQVAILLKKHRGNIESLEQTICRYVMQGTEVEASADFTELLQQFCLRMRELKQEGLSSQTILDDFQLLAPLYYGNCDRKGSLHAAILEQVRFFALLFDQNDWSDQDFDRLISDQLVILSALDPSQKKPKSVLPIKIHHPQLFESLKIKLMPIFRLAGSYLPLLARVVHDCQEMLRRYLLEEEKFRHDDLLKMMKEAIQDFYFAEKIRNSYRAVIIDEFQDTDALQWDIFHSLFIVPATEPAHGHEKGQGPYLYLVGDPKQSIYGFRQADIYTYLKASQELGEASLASLNVNYRSQASLVTALNTLFSEENVPGLMALPKWGKSLEYHPVQASATTVNKSFSDSFGSVHFCVAESKLGAAENWPTQEMEQQFFFPFIVQEMKRLRQQDQIQFHQWAILVRDRFQADRFASYCKKVNIPTLLQREEKLSNSPALLALKEVLEAVADPKDGSLVRKALGNRILGWNHLDIKRLNDEALLSKVLSQFSQLRSHLVEEGFASFYFHLLQSCWHDDGVTVRECLLQQQTGIEFFTDLQQIAELLMERQSETGANLQGLLQFIDEFPFLAEMDEEWGKKLQDQSQDAVRVLTIHTSKGLEFDLVFALGLANRTPRREELVPLETPLGRKLVVGFENDEIVQKYLQELDAEKMRQLYVAMTRAKYRLYLPVALMKDRPKSISLGEASPMELYLSALAKRSDPYSTIAEMDGEVLFDFIERINKEISFSKLQEQSLPDRIEDSTDSIAWKAPGPVTIPGTSQYVHSFSTLSSKNVSSSYIEEAPHDFFSEKKSVHTLPSGSEIGSLLHNILEQVSFSEPHQVAPLVERMVIGTAFAEWKEVIANILHHVLYATIPIGDETFRLCDLQEKKNYRELEFLYPLNQETFLKGFIDFVFEWKGKYYIIDWKSNWLGSDYTSYDQVRMGRAMSEHGYDLQATIYKEALRRYLELVEPRNFEDCFGGIFYLFLRGMREGSSDTGIYVEC